MVEREGEEGVLHYDLDLQCISQIEVSKCDINTVVNIKDSFTIA